MTHKLNRSLTPRRIPEQDRSVAKARQIRNATVKLLERVGFDDLTTILIAKELDISVGSLYHYYPNKHAILRALAEDWLDAWDVVLEEIQALELEKMKVETVVARMTELFAKVYKEQKAVLPLAQAMFSIPEIRDLDDRHDAAIILCLSTVFKRLGMNKGSRERERIGRTYLEITHALMLINAEQSGVRSARLLNEHITMCTALFNYHLAG